MLIWKFRNRTDRGEYRYTPRDTYESSRYSFASWRWRPRRTKDSKCTHVPFDRTLFLLPSVPRLPHPPKPVTFSSYFVPELVRPLSLSLSLSHNFFLRSFTFIIILSFSFLGLCRKELFIAALLFANLRRSVYTPSGFSLGRNSPFTCFTRCWTRIGVLHI